MEKYKIELTWRVALLVVMIIGIVIIAFWMVKMDREGLACQKQPFVWGAEKLAVKYDTGVACSCFTKIGQFSFNEQEFNPEQL